MELQKLRKQNKYFEESKAVGSIQENPKYFFSYAKRKSKIKTKVGPLLKKNSGEMTANSLEMADILADQYSSVFSKPSTQPPEISDHDPAIINNIQITPEEMIEAIDELKPSAASGPDGLPAILLMKCKKLLATPLPSSGTAP